MITIPRIAEVALEHRAFFLKASASGHVVACSPEGRVSFFSPGLTVLRQLDIGREPTDVALSPQSDLLAISTDESLAVIRTSDGGEQLRMTVGPGCAGTFSDDGTRLWTLHSEGEENLVVQLRDPRNGRVLRETRFAAPSSDLRCSFHPHPRRGDASVWVAAGQDGQWILWAHDTGAAITVVQAEEISECSPPCFNEEGTAFLVTAFDSLSRWSFPDHARTASVDEWPWSETEDDSVGESVAWAGAHRALVATNENRAYLVDLEKACVVDEVVLEGHPLRPIAELYPALVGETGMTTDLQFFEPIGNGRLISVHGRLETSRLVLSETTSLRRPY